MSTKKQENAMRACQIVDDSVYGRDVKYFVANSLEGPSREDTSYRGIRLWEFQFGSVGTTHVLVWTGKHSAMRGTDIDSALEEAAGALDTWGLKGHFVDDSEVKELIEEALEEDPELSDDEAYEAATADLTYTESGYLTSYEWTAHEVDSDSPLFERAAKKAMRDRRAEGWE